MGDILTGLAALLTAIITPIVFWIKIRKKARHDVDDLKLYLDVQVKKSNGVPFAFIENTPVPCWMKDLDGRYIFINQEYQQVFHCRSVDIEGRTDMDIWPEEVASKLRYNDDLVVRDRVQLQKVEYLPAKPGVKKNTGKILKPWLVTKFPVFGANKEIIAVGGVAVPANSDPSKQMAESTVRKIAPSKPTLNSYSNKVRLSGN